MEDYKKKYEDALKRAKEMCAMPSDKATMEYVFPELVESEDEMVRKEIISALKNANYEKIYDKHIAYLEKVKDFDKQLEDAYKNSDEVQYKHGYDAGYLEGITSAKKELAGQGEQKSTWKPTKEQIDAFTHFVQSVGESDYASPYDNNTKQLYSLLNDLKGLSPKEVTKKSEHDGKKWIDEKVYWKEREELFEDGKQEVINNPMKYGLIKDEDHIANASKKVWNDKDQDFFGLLEGYLEFDYTLSMNDKANTLDWLKSIKERLQ